MMLKVSERPRIKNKDLRYARPAGGSSYSNLYCGDNNVIQAIKRSDSANNSRSYGLEIELPIDHRKVTSSVLSALNALPIGRKSDGSIGDGVEFVFPPLSERQIIRGETYKAFFSAYQHVAGGPVYHSHGMHIHVSAAVMEASAVVAAHATVLHNADLFRWLAGRVWWDSCPTRGHLTHAFSALRQRDVVGYNDIGTVEFRIFDTAWSMPCVAASLDVVKAVVGFSRSARSRGVIKRILKREGLKRPDLFSVDPTAELDAPLASFHPHSTARLYHYCELMSPPTATISKVELEAMARGFARYVLQRGAKYPALAHAVEQFTRAPESYRAQYKGERSYRSIYKEFTERSS